MGAYIGTLRQFNRSVLLYLSAFALVGFVVDGGIYAVVFNLYLLRLGYDALFVGQVNAAGMFVFGLCSLPAGSLGARWGNRRAMILGLVLSMTGGLALPLGELLPSSAQPAWLIAMFAVLYLGLALFFVNAIPYLMAITAPQQRNHAFSVQAAVLALAGFVGSLVGGVLPGLLAATTGSALNSPAPYRAPLLIGAALLLIGIVALKMAQDGEPIDAAAPSTESSPPSPGRLSAAQARGAVPASTPTPARSTDWRGPGSAFIWFLAVVAVIRVFQIAGMGVSATFFNVYMDAGLGAPTAQIGVISAIARLLAVPAALLTPVLTARWGHRGLIVGASLVTALALLPMALVPVWWAAGAGFIGVIAFSSIRYPAFSAFVMEMVAPDQRSVTSAVSEMTAGLSFSVMALLGGAIIARSGYPALFLAGAAFTLLGTAIFWLYFRSPRRARAEPPQVTPEPAI